MDKIELIVERDWLRGRLAASEGRAKRLEEALEQIGLNLCYCGALGDAGPCFPCMARAALAEPAADAGGGSDG